MASHAPSFSWLPGEDVGWRAGGGGPQRTLHRPFRIVRHPPPTQWPPLPPPGPPLSPPRRQRLPQRGLLRPGRPAGGPQQAPSPISPLARSAVSKAPAAARQFLPPPQPPLPPAPATGSPPPPPPPPLRRNWLGPAWQHRLKHSHAKHHIWMDIGAGPDKSRRRPGHPARWMRMNQRSAALRANLFGSRRNSSPCLTRLGDLVRPGNGRNAPLQPLR